jgi:Protein of unknown function (DUF4231)
MKFLPDTDFEVAIQELVTLDEFNKLLFRRRFLRLHQEFERRCLYISILFHISRLIITVGSLIVPALLSIQYTGGSSKDTTMVIYWTAWTLSLLVTTSNGILTLFKIDKKYYSLHTSMEQLRSEGWQFLELSGRYSGFYTPNEKPTHTNQFLYFCHVIEKIKMSQVELEYYRLMEKDTKQTDGKDKDANKEKNTGKDKETEQNGLDEKSRDISIPVSLIPPTPLHPVLQKLLNQLSDEGGKTNPIKNSEVPVSPKLPQSPLEKQSVLQQAHELLPEAVTNQQMESNLQSRSLEQEQVSEKNT